MFSHVWDKTRTEGSRRILEGHYDLDENHRRTDALDRVEIDAFIDELLHGEAQALRSARLLGITVSCLPDDPLVKPQIHFLTNEGQVRNRDELQSFFLSNGTGPLDFPDEPEQLSLSQRMTSILPQDHETVQTCSREIARLRRLAMSPESNINRNPVDLESIYRNLCGEAHQGIYISRPVSRSLSVGLCHADLGQDLAEAFLTLFNADETDDEV